MGGSEENDRIFFFLWFCVFCWCFFGLFGAGGVVVRACCLGKVVGWSAGGAVGKRKRLEVSKEVKKLNRKKLCFFWCLGQAGRVEIFCKLF